MRLPSVAALFLLAICPAALSLALASPVGARKIERPRDSFADSVMKHINPKDIDYGARIEAARRLWVERALASPILWALLATLGLLVFSFAIVVHQHGEKMRREIIAATLLARYHNALLDARRRAEEAITAHNRVVNANNQARERTSTEQLRASTESFLEQPANDEKQGDLAASSADIFLSSRYQRAAVQESKGSGRPRRGTEPDLAAHVSALQQQLNASVERERSLEKELEKGAAPAASTRRQIAKK